MRAHLGERVPDTGALRILLVEDDPSDLYLIRSMLADAGEGEEHHEVLHADTLAGALAMLAREPIGLILTDLTLPDADRLDTFLALQRAAPNAPVVILTGLNDEALAIEAVHRGAQDYLRKDEVRPAALRRALRHAVVRARRGGLPAAPALPGPPVRDLTRLVEGKEPLTEVCFAGLRAASPAMHALFETCERVAATPTTVLLLGETGTGKELLARAIHERSARRGPFVAVNCAALPRELTEAELFGHERGAYTGADRGRLGLFRQAHEGTLLLDEVGSLAPSAQSSLLRALQERAVRPVGGRTEVPVDVRVLAATSEPIFQATQEGRFREDLLYRLDVIRIEVPPLRARPEDVLSLFRLFCARARARYDLEPPRLGTDFLRAMLGWPWPGNVRELENFTERLLLIGPGECLNARQFYELTRPHSPRGTQVEAEVPAASVAEAGAELSLGEFIEQQEQAYLVGLLEATRGRMNEAARRAAVDRRTLLRKLQRHGLDKADFR